MVGGLLRLTRRGRTGLIDGQLEALSRRVVPPRDPELRRARLAVPAPELAEIASRRLFHAGDEIIGGHRLAVEPFEVEVDGAAETLRSEKSLLHANQFGPLLVHGGGVEVVDLDVGFGPHRVRHRSRVLGKLTPPEQAHVLDPLHVPRPHVRGELLVPEDGESLFQAQLEPVAAGDAVACPVVEILVGDDRLYPLKILVGGTLRAGEETLRIEYIQPLVLHRPHVEVVHRHDHVQTQVVLAPVPGFVPGHCTLEGGHRVAASFDVLGFRVDPEIDNPSRGRSEAVPETVEVPGHQCEQVAGLGKRVFPDSRMPTAAQCLVLHGVAVGEQHGVARLVRDDGGPEARHDVGPVEVPRDPPEPLRLTLGAKDAAGPVEPLEGAVLVGADSHQGFDLEGIGNPEQGERGRIDDILAVRQPPAVHRHAEQIQPLPVQANVVRRVGRGRVAHDREATRYQCLLLPQVESEIHAQYRKCRRQVILQMDSLGCRIQNGVLTALVHGRCNQRISGGRATAGVHPAYSGRYRIKQPRGQRKGNSQWLCRPVKWGLLG